MLVLLPDSILNNKQKRVTTNEATHTVNPCSSSSCGTYAALSDVGLGRRTGPKVFLKCHGRWIGICLAVKVVIIAVIVGLLQKLFVAVLLQVVLLKLVRLGVGIHLLVGFHLLLSFHWGDGFRRSGRVHTDLFHASDVIIHYFPLIGLGSVPGKVTGGGNMEVWLEVRKDHVNSTSFTCIYQT